MLLITTYTAMQQIEQAEKMCNAVYQAEPENIDILLQLALIRKQQNRLDDALALFDKALLIQPDAVQVLVNKGLLLQMKGQIDEAIVLFQRVTQPVTSYSAILAYPCHGFAGKS